MTKQELMNLVEVECKKNGWHYLIQIDDGEHIDGKYYVKTDSRLHEMANAINQLSDNYSEQTK